MIHLIKNCTYIKKNSNKIKVLLLCGPFVCYIMYFYIIENIKKSKLIKVTQDQVNILKTHEIINVKLIIIYIS